MFQHCSGTKPTSTMRMMYSAVKTNIHAPSITPKIGFATGSHSPSLGSQRSHRAFTYWNARMDSMT